MIKSFSELEDGKRYRCVTGKWLHTVFVKTPEFNIMLDGSPIKQFGVICIPTWINHQCDVWTVAVREFQLELFEEL